MGICKHCNTEFKNRVRGNDINLYCSRECAFEYRRQNTGRHCKTCNKQLPINALNYCDEECKYINNTRNCEVCGNQFNYGSSINKTVCSSECRKAKTKMIYDSEEMVQKRKEALKEKEKTYIPKRKECPSCGETFYMEFGINNKKYCSDKCSKKETRKKDKFTRRMKISENGTIDKDITLYLLSKRDKNKCKICNRKVDYNDFITKNDVIICGNDYPSIDHIIPLSKGGTHTWNNVQLAHRICNTIKNDTIQSIV